jgi:hypothetical protein
MFPTMDDAEAIVEFTEENIFCQLKLSFLKSLVPPHAVQTYTRTEILFVSGTVLIV